ncbi:MAG: FAD:protein FMN transferase, partial [Planctomycetota bacterium]
MLRLNLILMAAGSLCPVGAGEPPADADALERIERRVAAMGTAVRLEVEAPERMAALRASELALRAIEATERRLSTWREDSELSLANAQGGAELSRETAAELATALDLGRVTGGAFDPTCGALVQAWGLREGGQRPSVAGLEAALGRVGLDRITLEHNALLLETGTLLEEGGWGKGAGLDRALAALEATDTHAATLDLGGQLAWYGAADRSLELAHPDRRGVPAARLTALLHHRSVATSGNSEQRLEVDGEPLGHLLDPRTGRPAPDFGSLTVLAPTALQADALSTGLYVLGPERALELASQFEQVDVIVLERHGDAVRLWCTGDIAAAVEPLPPTVLARAG